MHNDGMTACTSPRYADELRVQQIRSIDSDSDVDQVVNEIRTVGVF